MLVIAVAHSRRRTVSFLLTCSYVDKQKLGSKSGQSTPEYNITSPDNRDDGDGRLPASEGEGEESKGGDGVPPAGVGGRGGSKEGDGGLWADGGPPPAKRLRQEEFPFLPRSGYQHVQPLFHSHNMLGSPSSFSSPGMAPWFSGDPLNIRDDDDLSDRGSAY